MVRMRIEGNMVMDSKSNKPKWDGKSRVSSDVYRKNYDEVFKKKSQPKKDWWNYMECAPAPEEDFLDRAEREKKELEESYQESKRQTKERNGK